jgi:hypothetical protein
MAGGAAAVAGVTAAVWPKVTPAQVANKAFEEVAPVVEATEVAEETEAWFGAIQKEEEPPVLPPAVFMIWSYAPQTRTKVGLGLLWKRRLKERGGHALPPLKKPHPADGLAGFL